MTNMKNKILRIVIISVLVIVAIGGITTAFLFNYNNEVPNAVEIYQNDEETFISAKANTSYKGYKFVLSEGENEIVVESQSNVITLSKCLEEGAMLGKTYKVKVCYLGENANNNSQFSKEIEWKLQGILIAPEIKYSQDENMITWKQVSNADYYMVYYNDGQVKSVKVSENAFSLENVKTGERNFYVVAYSDFDYYKESKSSNVLDIIVRKEIKAFSSIDFNHENCHLILKNQDDLQNIIVYLDDQSYTCYKIIKTFDEEENIFIYEIDLSLLYKSQTKIGAKPDNIDEFNIYSGEIIYA